MQAQKQSTGDISRCHSGAAKKGPVCDAVWFGITRTMDTASHTKSCQSSGTLLYLLILKNQVANKQNRTQPNRTYTDKVTQRCGRHQNSLI